MVVVVAVVVVVVVVVAVVIVAVVVVIVVALYWWPATANQLAFVKGLHIEPSGSHLTDVEAIERA